MEDIKISNPFEVWPKTNALLQDFYKQPDINIGDNPSGLFKKNTMRHITGSAIEQKHYPSLAKPLGIAKEIWDLQTEPLAYMYLNKSFDYPKYLGKTVVDTIIDSNNNRIGRDYIKAHPNASDNEIMYYANEQAKNMYDNIKNPTNKIGNTLYNLLVEEK